MGALRDPSEPIYDIVRRAATATDVLQIDLLYGDHEGGQRTIARFIMSDWPEGDVQGKRISVLRYWNVDSGDPR